MNHLEIYEQVAGTVNNVTFKNVNSCEQEEIVNGAVDKETKRRVELVSSAKDFGVLTACWIDGEFVTTSNYDLPDEVRAELKQCGDVN